MLSLRAVNQFYGDNQILWDLDLDLTSGECTCVLGAPGQGKTTLVNCITGYLPVQSGSMLWQPAGLPPEDLANKSVERRTTLGIGYVPQGWRIFSQLSVEQNLQIAMMAGHPSPRIIPALIDDLFPELYSQRQVKSSELGGDMQQQLALAQALVLEPTLLILDEPTLGAGHQFITEMGCLIQRLNHDFGLTILLVEQRLSFIRRVADKFCLLQKGRNVAQGDISQLEDRLVAGWLKP